jgi:ABC-type multidrug transport system ATPase subunit
MTALLLADCVSKRHGERTVLASATLRAVRGELRALLGRNGVGKSTLLKIAAGIVQPDAGAVRWNQEVFERAQLPVLARRGLFFLPDHDLFSSAFTVRTQLEMLHRVRGSVGWEPVAAARRMGVETSIDCCPQALSGGEHRRSEVAAVMVSGASCVLADEPYRGISPVDADALTSAFCAMVQGGTAVIVTGHEVPTLFDAVDHLTWCTDGTTYELGPPQAARAHERFAREYLGR